MKAWVKCLGYSHHLSSSDCFPTSVKRTEIQATAIWSNMSWLFPNSNLHSVGNKVKGRISKRVFQENKARQIFQKTNISYPLIRTRTCAYQGVRNVRFSENLACFVFLKHPFWDSSFCLITEDSAKSGCLFIIYLFILFYLTLTFFHFTMK